MSIYVTFKPTQSDFALLMSLADRRKKARKDKKLSQQQLAQKANVHYTHVRRYERGDAKPSADVLISLSIALEVSTDFFMNATLDDKAKSSQSDQELLSQIIRIENIPEDRKRLLKVIQDAFILKTNLQQKLELS